MARPAPATRRSRPLLEDLEPRILFAADGPAALLGAAAGADLLRSVHDVGFCDDTPMPPAVQSFEIVFIDARVGHADTLLAGLRAEAGAGRTLEVVTIGAEEDAVTLIGQTLAERPGAAAVHLVSHGGDGRVQIGANGLDAQVLLARAPEVAAWGTHLTQDADLLIYGCDVASGLEGQALVQGLAQLTGADVAASNDRTGNTSLGGDWTLEVQTGAIEARLAFDLQIQANWQGVLATYTVTNTNSSGAGSLYQAILDANATTTVDDTIVFNIAGTGVHTILTGLLPTITDTVIIDATTDDSFAVNGNRPAIVLDGNYLNGSGLTLSNTADGSTIRGLVITNFQQNGIAIQSGSDGNTIAGNYIGQLTTSGTLGATTVGLNGVYIEGANNTIGGSTAADRNIFAGATDDAIEINGEASDGNIIQGNWIGLAANGATVLGTDHYGIYIQNGADNTLIGGSTLGQGNVIVGTGGLALSINGATSGTLIRGNYLGTDSTLSVSGGNYDGINLAGGAHDNLIGGTGASDGNYLANSTWNGIYLWADAGTGNAFLGNRIWNNDEIGIDLVGGTENSYLVTANDTGDADTGANNLQNFPVLTLAQTDGSSQVNVSGTLNSTASSHFRIEFFASPSADSSGYGEGQIYLGFANVATNASGNATISTTLSASVPVGYVISATATKSDVTYSTFTDTSEFARNIVAVSSTQAVVVVDTANDTSDGDTTSLSTLLANKGADGLVSLREAITAANNTANGSAADLINFGIAGTGIHTITLASALPTITNAVVIDASSDDSFAANGNAPAIVLDSSGQSNSEVLRLSSTADGSTLRGLAIWTYSNTGIQIDANSDGNTIAGNYIGMVGTDGNYKAGTWNGSYAVYVGGANNVVGGNTAADRNVVGNGSYNIFVGSVSGTGNQIIGNYVGVNASGTAALTGSSTGITQFGGAGGTTIANNVIASESAGIYISNANASADTITGNKIGLRPDGSATLGNAAQGVYVQNSDNHVITGNWIGGGSRGMYFTSGSDGNTVQGNRIGTDLTGNADWGATLDGLYIDGSNNRIGGAGAGEGNVIAFSNRSGSVYDGMTVSSGTGNAMLGNSIYGTLLGGSGLGIDLGTSGATANDSGDGDTGANNLQNFPVLTQARTDGSSQIAIGGTLNSTANSYFRIEFFATPTLDASGYGEGQIHLGFTHVASDGSGNASFSTMLAAAVPVGYSISATATRSDASYSAFTDTSEFARDVIAVSSTQAAITVDTAADTLDGDTTSLSTLLANKGADGLVSLREAITAANNTANGSAADLISFGIAGTGVHTITLGSALPSITDAVILDATTDDSFAVNGSRPAIALVGGGTVSTGLTLAAGSDGSTVRGLQINGFSSAAISLNSNSNVVAGNYIGALTATGAIGGSGNYNGIGISGDNNTIGGTVAADRNVISGNSNRSISLESPTPTGNRIIGNYIGTVDASGATGTPVTIAGIVVNGGNNTQIGGAGAGEGNLITGLSGNGVGITSGTGHAVLGNAIHSNNALGIDLGATGVTGNDGGDGDTGANNLQNFPILTAATTDGTTTVNVSGTLNSGANSYFRVELFASAIADPTTFGEGQIYLGHVNVATDGSGNATFTTAVSTAIPVGYVITATATQSDATYSTFTDTSEYSMRKVTTDITPGVLIVNTVSDTSDGDTTSIFNLLANRGSDGFISLREAITATNNTANVGGVADTINFGIVGIGVHTILLGSALPSITDSVNINASTDDSFGFNGNRPAIVLDVNGLAATNGLVLTNTADNSTIRGLVIRNHTLAGIRIDSGSDGNTVAGNYIGGLGADGNQLAAAASTQGIDVRGANNLIGGNTPADRNVISATNNGSTNILITGVAATGNTVKGNFIGTDATGTVGFSYSVTGLTVSGGATGTTVGGPNAGDGNVVFSSGSAAVYFVAGGTGNLIQGNQINVSTTGNQLNGLFGPSSGIVLDGSVGTVVNNWIGRTTQDGILLRTGSGSVVQGNRIGTDLAGTATWGTGRHGINVESGNNNLIGGTGAGQGNVVANSNRNNGTFDGIYVAAGTGNAVMGNAVYGVANGGLGIDLGTSGVTANDAGDADAGANNLQNFPVVTLATTDGNSQLGVAGTLISTASSYFRIEIFASAVANSSGYGEGAIFLGFVNVATDGSGNASFSTTLNVAVPVGYLISTTATRSNATYSTFTDTSEFGRNAVAISSTQGVLVVDTAADTADGDTTSLSTLLANRGADGFISLREAITAANNTTNGTQADRINFGIAGTGVHTISLASILPAISDAVIIDAATDDSFAGNSSRPAIVLEGNNRNGHGLELLGSADGSTIRGLVITNFRMDGIHIGPGSDGNTIAGNYIGKLTSGGGVGSAGNDVAGISIYGSNNIIGGGTALDRNVIAGNAWHGVYIEGASGNQILGNYIGTDATGNLANGNEEGGVYATNGATGNSIVNNVIAANIIDEISIIGETSDGNIIQGNRIGLGADGSTVLGTPGSDGIYIFGGSDNNLIGGSNPGQGNVVVGTDWAIWIKGLSSGNVIRGNFVGTDSSLSVAGGNVNSIVLDDGAFSNVVGGTAAGDRNYVTRSGLYGIDLKINAGTGNALLGNQLWNNAGLGIDIADIGVQANDAGDADTGANNLQNFPVLTQATTDGANISVAGTFNSIANSYFRIELFANATADPLGHGEGQIYLGFVNVATDGAGNAAFSTTLPVSVPVGYAISATATRSDATYSTFTDTSEFAAVLGVSAANAAPDITSNGGGATAAINVPEGTLSVTTVTATDANVPAQTLSYSISGGADQGQFSINSASGVLSFVAAPDFEAPGDTGGNNVYDIIVQVSDGNGGTDTQAIAVTVTNANDAPTVANAIVNQSATEDTAFNFQFAANTFADVDVGDTLTYSAQLAGGGALPAWLSFDAVTRTFSGTPLNADVGTVSIDVIANDGNGGAVTDTFNITVANTNDAPTVANAIVNQNATEDTAFNFQFAANTFADLDVGDTLTYSAQLTGGGALPAWLSFDAVTRSFSGTPLNADVGTVSVDVIANDGNGGTVTDTFDITVANSNDAPTVANPIPDQNATENTPFNFTFQINSFNDQDTGDLLTYAAQLSGGGALPAWLSFDAATRTFAGTPANGDVGTISIEVIASDSKGTSVMDTFNIVVGNTNDSPFVANAIPNQSATEDVAFNFTFAANAFDDPDVGDTLSFSASGLPGWLNFDPGTRTFSGTPTNADVGTLSLTVTATDGGGHTVSDTFDLVVANSNDAPTVANALADQGATEDVAFNWTFAVNAFSDVDAFDSLTYSASGLPAWLSFDAATRSFFGTPSNADVGTVAVTVRATDGAGAFVQDSFNLGVANTNDAPTVANAIVNQNATEDTAFNYQFAANTFADLDVGDTLSYSAQLAGGGALPAWLSFDAITRTFSGTPANSDVGTVSIDVIANDGNGGTATDTFSITTANTNDTPTIANAVPNQNATEGAAFNFQLAANTFADADVGDTLTYSAQLAGGGLLPGWLSFDAVTRTFSGTPTNGDVGTVSIDVMADDGNGGTVTDAFNITVANTNDAPTVANAIVNQNATEDTAFNFQFAADTFADVDVGNTLTYSAQIAGGGALPAWLSFDSLNRTFSGTPTNADVGTVSIDVIANDANGGTVTDTFNIAVGNTNDAPTVANAINNQTASEGAAFNFQFAANTFADVDVGDTLSYSAQLAGGGALPAWLSFDAVTRTFSGTPTNGDVGTVSVDVIAFDGNGGTVTDTFNISVTNTNNAPTVANAIGNQNAAEDTPYNFTFAANSFADADVGDTFSYSASGLPAWLSFDAATHSFSGTPTNADVGTLAITLRATDSAGAFAEQSFSITVANTNDAPTLVNPLPDQNAAEGTPFSFTLPIGSFSDPDAGDLLTYSAQRAGGGALPAWLSFDAATQTFSGTPANGDVGMISIEVTAADGNGGSVTDTFDIRVGNSNNAPFVANPMADQSATEGVAFGFTFAANAFADPDVGDTLTYNAQTAGGAALPAWLSFDALTRNFSGTPRSGDVGTLVIEVTAQDGHGGAASETFSISVAQVNQAPSGAPAITGTPITEQTLVVDTSGLADPDGLGPLSYQWLRDGEAIAGATSPTYQLGEPDVGRSISVRVSYTDGRGTGETLISSAIQASAPAVEPPGTVPGTELPPVLPAQPVLPEAGTPGTPPEPEAVPGSGATPLPPTETGSLPGGAGEETPATTAPRAPVEDSAEATVLQPATSFPAVETQGLAEARNGTLSSKAFDRVQATPAPEALLAYAASLDNWPHQMPGAVVYLPFDSEVRHGGAGGIESGTGADATTPPFAFTANAVALSGMVVSLGALAWGARSSMLLASLLMSTPSWRAFDLLPVLGASRDKRNEDDESVAANLQAGRTRKDFVEEELT